MRKIRHIFEATLLCSLMLVFAVLPMRIASTLGGKIGQILGFLLKKRNRIAFINLKIAFPKINDSERKFLISKMWNNLGRIFAEMPHWYFMNKTKMKDYIELPDTIPEIMSSNGKKCIVISGHYGNWELCNHVLPHLGMKTALVYRTLENKYMNWLLKKIRESKGAILVKKDKGGIKSAIKLFKSGLSLGMLVDQRHLNGEMIPFFGKDAPTVVLPAKLASQDKVPIIMINIMRIQGIKYKVELKEIPVHDHNYRDIMVSIHNEMEKVIEKYPEQWFWIHKRWPQENY